MIVMKQVIMYRYYFFSLLMFKMPKEVYEILNTLREHCNKLHCNAKYSCILTSALLEIQ